MTETLKYITIGDSGVGKTCILTRFAENKYEENNISTVGVDFKLKNIKINDIQAKLQLWDTAGQERFDTISTSYYRGSHAIILCCSITDKESFKSLARWLTKNSENVPVFLMLTKIDISQEERAFSVEEFENFAKEKKMTAYKVSAKENENIDESFEDVTLKILESHQNKNKPPQKTGVKIKEKMSNKPKLGGCC